MVEDSNWNKEVMTDKRTDEQTDRRTDGQADRQTEFPLVYSTPVRAWVNIKHRRRRNVKIHDTLFTFLTILLLWQFYFFDNFTYLTILLFWQFLLHWQFYFFDSGRYSTIMSATRLTSMSSTMSTTPHRPSCQPPISSPCQLTRRHLVILKKKGYPISRESWSLGLVNCIHDINSQNVYTNFGHVIFYPKAQNSLES